jgi:hypothetical protein
MPVVEVVDHSLPLQTFLDLVVVAIHPMELHWAHPSEAVMEVWALLFRQQQERVERAAVAVVAVETQMALVLPVVLAS